jgi:hypothetical protein
MKKLTFLLLTLATTLTLNAQVAINTDNSLPNGSAILDVKSTTKGMLVPRMNTTQRANITSPANGLLVYDLTTESFWFYQNSNWTELRAGNITALTDTDGDTKVVVDDGNDYDIIKFYSGNSATETFRITDNRFEPKDSLFNILIGVSSGQNITNGFRNTAIGYSALSNTTIGQHNIAIGFDALLFNISGSNNTALGSMALQDNESGYENIAIGNYSLISNKNGSRNVAVGASALYNNKSVHYNVAVGYKACYSDTSGSQNTGIGSWALLNNKTGRSNVAIGAAALYSNTTRSNLVAVGDSSLYNNTDGNDNTATGSKTLFNNTTGNHNTVMGSRTMYANISGAKNTALGYRTFYSHNSGNCNTVLGSDAMSTNTSGANNVAVGANAGTNLSSGSNNIIIGGNYLDFPSATNSNQLNIGNIIYGINIDGTGNTISAGNIGIGVMYPEERLHVDGNIRMDYSAGVYWTRYIDSYFDYNFAYAGTALSYISHTDGTYYKYSDRRLKSNIQSLTQVLPSILALQPVTYYFKASDNQQEEIGLIAQDVEKLFPQAVGEKNGYKSIDYAVFGVLAIEAVKEQQQLLETQNQTIANLEQRLEKLEKLMKNK